MYAVASALAGDYQSAPGPIKPHQFTQNVRQRTCKANIDPYLPQHSGGNVLLRAQFFLTLCQVTKQKPHHNQVQRFHEELFWLDTKDLDLNGGYAMVSGPGIQRSQGSLFE